MAPRDYEMERAAAAVEGRVDEPIERALEAGSIGSQSGTPGKTLKAIFGKAKRESGLGFRNVVVLTSTSVRVFSCKGRGSKLEANDEVAVWPRDGVRVEAVTGEQWSAFNASDSGSVTNHFYVLTFTPASGGPPISVECPRTDSARATIQALEDATGSPPSKITARRRKKQAEGG